MDWQTRARAIFSVLLVGFLVLVVVVRHEHREALHERWQAWIPIVYAILAALACFASLAGGRPLRMAASAVFLAGTLVGPIGLYLHIDGQVDRLGSVLAQEAIVAHADEEGEESEGRSLVGKSEEPAPPPLAPLAFAGLSAVGLLVSWPGGRRRAPAGEP
ncbi:MAG: hypothetical protein KIS66_00220 [Fimbriimonadaceae bacterium]|nr:hypothetical protein [Fimbriimonadaceae bacterium]